MHIATYNARTLSSKEKLLEFELALERVKWDVVGISEVRRRGEESLVLSSGHRFIYCGENNTSNGGVGLFITRRWADKITDIVTISSRVIYVCLKLNRRHSIKIIQAYAPTSTHSDEEMERFYDDVSKAMNENRTHYMMLIGDFNAKVGKKADETENAVGNFGYDHRNERGEMLLNFLHQNNMFAANTFFPGKRQRKWTWASADGVTKNEIDYIVTPRMDIVQNVTVLNNFSTGSDHRMVRAKVAINTRLERSKMIKKAGKRDVTELERRRPEYQLSLIHI